VKNNHQNGSAIRRSQAHFFATCITRLSEVSSRVFPSGYDPEAGHSETLWSLQEYEVFHDAAYACGFVCNDFKPTYPIDLVNTAPQKALGEESLSEIRHYIHTLLRAERSNRMDGYFSPVLAALCSGALNVVAHRLITDYRFSQQSANA